MSCYQTRTGQLNFIAAIAVVHEENAVDHALWTATAVFRV